MIRYFQPVEAQISVPQGSGFLFSTQGPLMSDNDAPKRG